MGVSTSIEDRHLHHVPANERHGSIWRQGPLWFLGNFQPLTLAIAFIGPLLGLNGLWTSVAGIAGIVLGAIFMTAHATQGPLLGLPQMIQSRAQFGYRGVIIPVVATTLTFIGFNVVTIVTIKQGLAEILHWNTAGVSIIAMLCAAVLAIWGHDWIHNVVIVVFFASLPLWVVLTISVFTGHAGGVGHATGGFSAAGFLATFAIAASYNITYAPCVSDYSRYLASTSSRKRVSLAVFLGAVGSPLWLIPLGAWMATRLDPSDALSAINTAGNNTAAHVGTVLALIAVVALVVAMSMSAYSGMLSVLTIVDSFRTLRSGRRLRIMTITTMSLVSLVLGLTLTNATTVLNDWLLVMLYLLAPWTAINLTDFYVARRGLYAITELFTPKSIYGSWNARGITAYVVGLLVEIPFVNVPGAYQSPGATWLQGVDISWLLGIVTAALVYLALVRNSDRDSEMAAVLRSNELLNIESSGGQ